LTIRREIARRFDGGMRPQKITFGEMREMGVRGIFVHSVRGPGRQIATAWPHTRTKQMMFASAAAGAGGLARWQITHHAKRPQLGGN
jgi:hypothetical protein